MKENVRGYEDMGLRGPVEKVIQSNGKVYFFNKAHKLIEAINYYNDSLQMITKYTYDDNLYLLREEKPFSNGIRTFYKFNDAGNIISSKSSTNQNENFQVTQRVNYKYIRDSNKVTKTTFYSHSDSLIQHSTYNDMGYLISEKNCGNGISHLKSYNRIFEYDINGNMITHSSCRNGKLDAIHKWEYDKNSREIISYSLNHDNTCVTKDSFIYHSEQNDNYTILTTDCKGTLEYKYDYIYSNYDYHNNWLTQEEKITSYTSSSGSSKSRITTRKIEYFK